MKYPLVIFDFDGTLADSLPVFLGIMNRLADQYGFQKIEAQEHEKLRTLNAKQLFKHLGIPFWKLPGITRKMRLMMAEEADRIMLFPGIEQFLRRLTSGGIQLAIVSSNSWENIQKVLGPANTLLFAYAECEASLFGKRPKLRHVLRQAKLAPEQAIYIGDELRDLEAAHAERLAFGAVSWGHAPLSQFLPHGPQEVFETVEKMGATLAPQDETRPPGPVSHTDSQSSKS